MKKQIVAMTLASLFAGGAIASEFTGGLEIDHKFDAGADAEGNKGTVKDDGLKIFAGYNGFGLSAKRNTAGENEFNANYTHDLETFWLKGEVEGVVRTKGSNDVIKAGLTAGTSFDDYLDVSIRYRKDQEVNKKNVTAEKSNVDRFDFFVGSQVTERVYFGAKVVNQTERNSTLASQNNGKNWNNYELRASFTSFEAWTPFVEIGNEQTGLNKRDSYAKFGAVFAF
ncbi:hypothetical protein LNL84_08795 [Vibrio sp. ZSDZ34]|jgi:hypothetical protein|uniref:Porin n=1 Tax=Vibrio gelatinilyticus TaxID=2893468 RepID=A0A9X2AW75_9VIBR|nr:oligogalacturonate-specific porin KdgM family protein [Vibrio gelatinilyticus]MCJ2376931.1 hypothetical protein [Vibrio gelatinilyticus]